MRSGELRKNVPRQSSEYPCHYPIKLRTVSTICGRFSTCALKGRRKAGAIEIYSPLADRLGISKIKIELDDLALRYLNLMYTKELEERSPDKRSAPEVIDDIIARIDPHGERGDRVPKSTDASAFFSIYKKMLNQHKTLDQIYADCKGIS